MLYFQSETDCFAPKTNEVVNHSTTMRSSSHLLAIHPLQYGTAAISRPATIMSPPPPRPPTSASNSFPAAAPPLFDAVVSAFFEQLSNSVADFSDNQHWRMVGSWQAQGMPDEVIYDTLQTMFPFHGSPLTLYEELYLPALSGKGATPIKAQSPLASKRIETQQRRRQPSQLPFTRTTVATATARSTTPMLYPKSLPAPGMLLLPPVPLGAFINNNNNKIAVVINVGDYVNVRAGFSQGFYSRGGNGYVAYKESANGIDFVFTVAYVETVPSAGRAESNITMDRLTVLPPSPFLALGPKQGIVPASTPHLLSGDTYMHGARLLSPAATASLEPKIPGYRLAVQPLVLAPAPFSADRPKRKGSTLTTQSSKDDDDNTINSTYSPPERLFGHENLAEYLKSNHSLHRANGWRQDDFPDFDLAVASVKRELLLQDIMWMENYLNQKGRRKGPKQVSYGSFCSNSFVRKRDKDNNDDDEDEGYHRAERIHPLTMRYLAYSWGVGKNTPKELLKRVNYIGGAVPVGSSTKNQAPWKQRSVIECRKTALTHYSAKHLYIRHRINERRRLNMHHEVEKYKKDDDDNDDASTGSFLTHQCREDAKEAWDAMDEAAQRPWEQKAKWHDEMQPSVQQILVTQINIHPYRTYDQLAMDIGDWCGASTIQRWLTAKRASQVD
jgi:hypothetical protein